MFFEFFVVDLVLKVVIDELFVGVVELWLIVDLV